MLRDWSKQALHKAGRRVIAVAAVAVVPLVTGPTAAAFAQDVPGTRIGPWTLSSTQVLPASTADEGVATLVRAGRTTTITRGVGSIPADLLAQGWIHIGDPDSRDGYVIDAYQGRSNARSKLFVITAPDGVKRYYRHDLDPGETYHNSFAAFTPDRTWFIAGEWGTVHRLEVFASTPTATVTSPTHPATIKLATSIRLTRPMTDVQGCVFAAATTLLCTSSNTAGADTSVPDPLILVHLDRAVGTGATSGEVTGTPTVVGAVAQDQTCLGVGETEGLDVQGSTLTIAVNSPCRSATLLSTYRLSH